MMAFLRRVEKGMKVAALAGGLLATWTGLLRLLAGAEPFRRAGVTYSQMALLYLLGGAAAGAVAGALAPLARSRLGGPLVGLAASVPVAAVASYLGTGQAPWRSPAGQDWLVVLGVLGALLGTWFPGKAREIDGRAPEPGR